VEDEVDTVALLKLPRDRKPFPATLDTVDIGSCGIAINIMFVIGYVFIPHLTNF